MNREKLAEIKGICATVLEQSASHLFPNNNKNSSSSKNHTLMHFSGAARFDDPGIDYD